MRDLLSFFTVIPVGWVSLQRAARQIHLLPLVGIITGLPGALLLLTGYFLPAGVAATLALGTSLFAAGLHHSDGVLDVGDALMVRGTAERRREVLKDTRLGIGGIGALFLVYAPAVTALAALCVASPGRAALALLAGEVSARSAILLTLAFGEPAEANSSSVPFVRALSRPDRVPGLVLALLAPLPFLLPGGASASLALLAAPLVALLCVRVSGAMFDGIGGDVVGCAGEVARTVVLVVLSTTM